MYFIFNFTLGKLPSFTGNIAMQIMEGLNALEKTRRVYTLDNIYKISMAYESYEKNCLLKQYILEFKTIIF